MAPCRQCPSLPLPPGQGFLYITPSPWGPNLSQTSRPQNIPPLWLNASLGQQGLARGQVGHLVRL